MARKESRFELVQDKKGMVWDLVLYVPVVVVLLSLGLQLWYGSGSNWSYLLVFLATLFFLIGANRILKTRLMVLPGAAVALDIERESVGVQLRSGSRLALVKDLRFFSEIGGKTFALTGMDMAGAKHQFIFHAGQFPSEAEFKDAKARLEVYR